MQWLRVVPGLYVHLHTAHRRGRDRYNPPHPTRKVERATVHTTRLGHTATITYSLTTHRVGHGYPYRLASAFPRRRTNSIFASQPVRGLGEVIEVGSRGARCATNERDMERFCSDESGEGEKGKQSRREHVERRRERGRTGRRREWEGNGRAVDKTKLYKNTQPPEIPWVSRSRLTSLGRRYRALPPPRLHPRTDKERCVSPHG